jgi:hypothetical protein
MYHKADFRQEQQAVCLFGTVKEPPTCWENRLLAPWNYGAVVRFGRMVQQGGEVGTGCPASLGGDGDEE